MFSSFEMSLGVMNIPFLFVFFYLFFLFVSKGLFFLKMPFFLSDFLFTSFSFNFQVNLVIFFFIFFMNFFSLLPYSFSFSSMQSMIIMAFFMWVSLFTYLFYKKVNSNLSHFLPVSTPGGLVFLLVWIEVVSTLARPIALGIRLMANIMASHLLLQLSGTGLEVMSWMCVFLLPLFICLFFLEVCVALIQSYVFSMLLSLFTTEME